jgi:hypothetical protein
MGKPHQTAVQISLSTGPEETASWVSPSVWLPASIMGETRSFPLTLEMEPEGILQSGRLPSFTGPPSMRPRARPRRTHVLLFLCVLPSWLERSNGGGVRHVANG